MIKKKSLENLSDEKALLYLKELCCIVNARNRINRERSKARYSKRYYEIAVMCLQNYYSNGISKTRTPKPKWIKMGLDQIKRKVLMADKAYVKAKVATCKLTIKTHKKVLFLCKKLNASLRWSNGYVDWIVIRNRNITNDGFVFKDILYRNTIKKIAEDFEAEKAITKMLT